MSDDQPDWLDVREPHDHASRSNALAAQFLHHLSPDARIIDLACGSGSNARYLLPVGGDRHRWLCIDHDENLLKRASTNLPASQFDFMQLDLANGLTDLSLALSGADALTTSAFLDLTSAQWLDHLTAAIGVIPFFAAMTVCGPVNFHPNSAADTLIQKQLLLHQCSDHGFGPSIGPDANNYLASGLRKRGNFVTIEQSNWNLGPAAKTTQRLLIKGIARRIRLLSAAPLSPKIEIEAWQEERTAQINAGTLRVVVPHSDLLSLPPT